MTTIPDHIKQAAIAAWNESTRMSIRRQGDPWEPIARALMAERLAERERCAKVADQHAIGGCACEGYGCTCGNYDDAGSAGGAATAKHIATAIRGQS